MHALIKFNRPLPLVMSVPNKVYEIWVEYGESTGGWHVAMGRLGDGEKRSITVEKHSRQELEQALSCGVELLDDSAALFVASHLVSQNRAEFVAAA